MLRSSLFTASAFALVAGAAAQSSSPLQATAQRVTSPVKYAGTYNVQTKTWVRGQSASANFGQTDNIYSNTAASGYYSSIAVTASPGGTIVDNAQIPSSSNPGPFSLGGLRDSSEVTGVQIGYCDFDLNPGAAGWTLDFYNTYDICSGIPDPAQLAFSVTASGLPANGCWIVDLAGIPAGSAISHDGDGFFDGVPALDTFGIAHTYTGTGIDAAGFLLTGDPVATDTGHVIGNNPLSGSNTFYGEIGNCPGVGSGYNNDDAFQLNDISGAFNSGCYFFGGYSNNGSPCGGPVNPPGSWYTEISGQDGGGGPGGPISDVGCTGNTNATGVPGDIEVNGSAVATDNNAIIRAFNLPTNEFGIFATGLAPIAPGTINSGNGTLCINPGAQGGLGRFGAANQIKNTGAAGEITLDTNAGEWDLSVIPTSVGTYAAAAGTTSYFQAWHREQVGTGYNFSGSCSVAWQ